MKKSICIHTYTKLLLFRCSELSLCCLFSSMVWEVAPKPLSPPLWTPECIRPRLLMKMKMRTKSHLLLVGGNGASLRGEEGFMETRLWSLNNPTEPLRHFTMSNDYSHLHPCAVQFSSNYFSPTSKMPPERSRRKQGTAEIHPPVCLGSQEKCSWQSWEVVIAPKSWQLLRSH